MTVDRQDGGQILALLRIMSARRRKQFALLLLAIAAGAAAEVLAIVAVIPFVSNMVSRDLQAPAQWSGAIPLDVLSDAPVSAPTLLIIAIIAAAVLRLTLLRLSQHFAHGFGHDIAVQLFHRVLHQPYSAFLLRNSSETLSGIEKVQVIVGAVILPLVQAGVALVLAVAIVAVLAFISPLATALAVGFLLIGYFLTSRTFRRRLRSNSVSMAQLSQDRIRCLQEALGGIRDIMLDRSQPFFEERFRLLDHKFREALATNAVIAQAPRYIIEAIGLIALALVVLALGSGAGGVAAFLPLLAALAFGAQRLLPLTQQAYLGWSYVTGNQRSLTDVLALLSLPQSRSSGPQADCPFAKSIAFDKVSFSYDRKAAALRSIDVNIRHGERIGIAGPTGSGKSTFVDLLMGLIDPSEGKILIDRRLLDGATRRNWQSTIAHVPQSVYLSDATIRCNIAVGLSDDEVDEDLLCQVAAKAQIDDWVAALSDGYGTIVGENGNHLSGGERQRIGIARALYKQARLLILDEATSALAEATEDAILDTVMALDRSITIVMVSHRPRALARCDRIIRLRSGAIVDDRSAGEIGSSPGAGSAR